MMSGRRLSEAAPGDRGQGRRRGPAREPDPGLGHHPELLRLYAKLSGMTGTAATERGFRRHLQDGRGRGAHQPPVSRIDEDDEVYRTEAEKNTRHPGADRDCYRRGQPILVGTVSIEKSETLSEILSKHRYEVDGKTKVGIPHQVLNARYHEQRPLIVADAGSPARDHRHQQWPAAAPISSWAVTSRWRVEPLAHRTARPRRRVTPEQAIKKKQDWRSRSPT